jgi:hypothetical protein
MDDLSGLWGRFSLTETEEEPFDFGSEEDNQFYLAARFMTGRILNVESVVRTFRPLWRTVRGFTVRDMGHNVLVFAFEDVTDLEKVLQGEPWSFDKYLVSFQRVEIDTDVKEMECGFVSFWVQIHNLPVGRMKHELASALGAAVGKVEHVAENEAEKGCDDCMRVRVRIDISKPLCRGRKARLASGRETWISFKYERLPIFCYWCGCLTHGERDCELWLRNKGVMNKAEQQYGAWLRADVEKPVRRVEVKVAGRSNVPRWGQQLHGGSRVSPEFSENAVHGSAGVNEPVLEREDIRDSLPPLRESGKDFEKELSEIDEILNYTAQNQETNNEAEDLTRENIILETRDPNKKEKSLLAGGEVDKEIEELRTRVILQDIFGKNDMDGSRSSGQKKNPGKENSPCNGNQDTMVEVPVQGESRTGWKRFPRDKENVTTEGVTMSLLGIKRAGSRLEGQFAGPKVQKKGREAVAMEGVEVVGDSAEAGQQPRRTQ